SRRSHTRTRATTGAAPALTAAGASVFIRRKDCSTSRQATITTAPCHRISRDSAARCCACRAKAPPLPARRHPRAATDACSPSGTATCRAAVLVRARAGALGRGDAARCRRERGVGPEAGTGRELCGQLLRLHLEQAERCADADDRPRQVSQRDATFVEQ